MSGKIIVVILSRQIYDLDYFDMAEPVPGPTTEAVQELTKKYRKNPSERTCRNESCTEISTLCEGL